MNSVYILILLSFLPLISSGSFKAAVVSHTPKLSIDNKDKIKKNIEIYREILEKISSQHIDIIVFPEYGLTGWAENIENYAIELPNDEIVREFRDMSIEYSIVLVINLVEKEQNRLFNTNLVINKDGAVLVKYRKKNLNKIKEKMFSAGNDIFTFEVNGEKFTTFTNEDLLSEKMPEGVTNLVIPMNWENGLPFEMGSSIQAAFSIKNKVNVLASNHINASFGLYGNFSDFKQVENVIIGTFNNDGILGNLGNISYSQNVSGTIQDYLKGDYLSEPNDKDNQIAEINLEPKEQTLTNREFNCKTTISYIDNSREQFFIRTLASITEKIIKDRNYRLRMCTVLMCQNEDFATCGQTHDPKNVSFPEIKVETNLDFGKSLPLTLNSQRNGILDVKYSLDGKKIKLEASNLSDVVNVFGVVEYTPISTGAATSFYVNKILLFVIYLYYILD